MKKLIGNEIEVRLKDSGETICGLLVMVEDTELYLQASDNDRVFVVPRENVRYYVTNKIPSVSRVIDTNPQSQLQSQQTQSQQFSEPVTSFGVGFRVRIDDQVVCQIPVPPTFDLDVWHDDIMRVAMGDPDVKVAMLGRIQKQVEYFAPDEEGWAEVKFSTLVDENAMTQQVLPKPGGFNVNMGGNPATEYLSPSQMVARMNKVRGAKE